ncbi:MAG: hypothetical protein HYU97_00035 [Deltaproteobacteria bacterium]|nr:hypothetical protein [Deltaproteobacteria bacterium]
MAGPGKPRGPVDSRGYRTGEAEKRLKDEQRTDEARRGEAVGAGEHSSNTLGDAQSVKAGRQGWLAFRWLARLVAVLPGAQSRRGLATQFRAPEKLADSMGDADPVALAAREVGARPVATIIPTFSATATQLPLGKWGRFEYPVHSAAEYGRGEMVFSFGEDKAAVRVESLISGSTMSIDEFSPAGRLRVTFWVEPGATLHYWDPSTSDWISVGGAAGGKLDIVVPNLAGEFPCYFRIDGMAPHYHSTYVLKIRSDDSEDHLVNLDTWVPKAE